DAIIPRIGVSRTYYGCSILRQFELQDTYCLNESDAIMKSRDKLQTIQILNKYGIGVPTTGYANNNRNLDDLISRIDDTQYVVKPIKGSLGIGVVLAETKNSAKSFLEALYDLNSDVIIQEYIKESNGSDIRVIVLGDRIIGAMKRQGVEGEFRANIHRGGDPIGIELEEEEVSIAITAAKILGLNFAGVDILRSKAGPKVIEVNSSPGLEGIEKSTGKDIAGEIIQFIEKGVKSGQ
ncbi:MAG: RimK family alpha-L-glutamate ligase, partial [Candidatus Dadabacteria bacterium]|nr:RimK family alpha-L-glutamate ligase [Candidatus Dadabacteria bacterium]NIQ16699.1 RimK family alpha-L-glutamate ligase [Candidatus Dadabacteria bacterium]